MDAASLTEFFDEKYEFGGDAAKPGAGDDLFALLESLDNVVEFPPLDATFDATRLASQKSSSSSTLQEMLSETELELTPASSPKRKRAKLTTVTARAGSTAAAPVTWSDQEAVNGSSDGQEGKVSHITVERNRRKQMNEHLTVLRSLMPCFYVKRGDQASIIGGVVDYINELQQVLHSLEAKKQRKIYTEVLSPRVVSSSPRPLPPLLISPRKPPPSPRTPQPGSPYKPRLGQQGFGSLMISSPTVANSLEPSPTSSRNSSSSIINDNLNELSASSKSAIADVEVKFSGSNLLLKTVSHRIPGQAAKIIAALEDLSLEILNVNISTVDETMFNSFTIKIGIECQLSAEELAHQIQQTFC